MESVNCAKGCAVGISVFNLEGERIKKDSWTKGGPTVEVHHIFPEKSTAHLRSSILIVCQKPVCEENKSASYPIDNGTATQECNSDDFGWRSYSTSSFRNNCSQKVLPLPYIAHVS